MRKNTSAVAEAVMKSSDTNSDAHDERERAVAEQVHDPVARAVGRRALLGAGAGGRRAVISRPAAATAANVAALTSIATSVPPSPASTPPSSGPAVMPA